MQKLFPNTLARELNLFKLSPLSTGVLRRRKRSCAWHQNGNRFMDQGKWTLEDGGSRRNGKSKLFKKRERIVVKLL